MKNIGKITRIASKFMEVVHWIAAAATALVAICSVVAEEWIQSLFAPAGPHFLLSFFGLEMEIVDGMGTLDMTKVLLFFIGAWLMTSLMAMSFRNVSIMMKKTQDTASFQPVQVRLLREIGIFQLTVPAVGLTICGIVRLVCGADAIETSMQMSGVITGILVLCLTQFFAHGVALEKDVAGLL